MLLLHRRRLVVEHSELCNPDWLATSPVTWTLKPIINANQKSYGAKRAGFLRTFFAAKAT